MYIRDRNHLSLLCFLSLMRSLRILLVVVDASSFLCARFVLPSSSLSCPAYYVRLATTHFPFASSSLLFSSRVLVMAYWAIARAGNEARACVCRCAQHHPSWPRYNDIFCLTSLLYENISLTFFVPSSLFPSGLIRLVFNTLKSERSL